NAMLKARTRAKRRLTLSLCGLGMLDELEVATIPSTQLVDVDAETGEILRTPPLRFAERVTTPPVVADSELEEFVTPPAPDNLLGEVSDDYGPLELSSESLATSTSPWPRRTS